MPAITCAICGKPSYEGLNVGSGYICAACEAKVACAKIGTREYEGLMRAIKRISPSRVEITNEKANELEAGLDMEEKISVDALLQRVGLVAQEAPARGQFGMWRAFRGSKNSNAKANLAHDARDAKS